MSILTNYLVFNVYSPEHLKQVAFGVLKELADLKYCFQLVELLNLNRTKERMHTYLLGNNAYFQITTCTV